MGQYHRNPPFSHPHHDPSPLQFWLPTPSSWQTEQSSRCTASWPSSRICSSCPSSRSICPPSLPSQTHFCQQLCLPSELSSPSLSCLPHGPSRSIAWPHSTWSCSAVGAPGSKPQPHPSDDCPGRRWQSPSSLSVH